MSGHSKWATIKRKKAKTDSARAGQWNKLIKEISVAAKMGGGDPDSNTRLRAAIIKAKGQSMPAKNIESAIKKGLGSTDSAAMDELMYEGYGPEGTAIIVKSLTDNKTRTVADVRNCFNKNGGNMGEPGSVSWGFDNKGVIIITEDKIGEEELFDLIIEAGGDDLVAEEGIYEISTSPEDFLNVMKAIEEKGIEVESAEMSYIAQNPVKVSPQVGAKLMKIVDKLEDNEDVQDVYHNAEFDEE
ncbi:MAG: YebC/PmpR family DNA-binding transcriptional regulator [Fibrobacterales bacterium]